MLTLIDAGRPVQVAARIDGECVAIPAADVERALGWTLTPEGLCGAGRPRNHERSRCSRNPSGR